MDEVRRGFEDVSRGTELSLSAAQQSMERNAKTMKEIAWGMADMREAMEEMASSMREMTEDFNTGMRRVKEALEGITKAVKLVVAVQNEKIEGAARRASEGNTGNTK